MDQRSLNVRAKPTKLLEENIGINLREPGFGKRFLDLTSNSQTKK